VATDDLPEVPKGMLLVLRRRQKETSMIVIDAGHGGAQPRGRSRPFGRRGTAGTLEKDVTLALARSVSNHLGHPTVLTRGGDMNLSLAERQSVVTSHDANVFLSLHAGSGAGGCGTYVHPLSGATSMALGGHIGRVTGLPVRRRQALAVLHPWYLPAQTAAAVVEVDSLASRDGEHRLRDPAVLERYGRTIATGVRRYLLTDGHRGRGVVFGTVREANVSCAAYPRSYPIFTAIGTDDPVAVIRAADTKAIELLDSTIAELEHARSRIVDDGQPVAWPTVSDHTAASLRTRMLLDPNDSAIWTGTGPRTVAFVVKWLKNIRKILDGGHVKYTCLDVDTDCPSGTWASAIPGQYRIYLCRKWWRGGDGSETEAVKLLNRASSLIHEASHIYYDTVDDAGRGIWRADCLEQLVSDLSGEHIPAAFEEACGPQDPTEGLGYQMSRAAMAGQRHGRVEPWEPSGRSGCSCACA